MIKDELLFLDQILIRIGNKLYQIRISKNEKVVTVAKEIDINVSVVSQVENGRYRGLSLNLLSKFAAYYKISVDELILSLDITGHDQKDPKSILIDFLLAENTELKKKIVISENNINK